MFRIITNYAIWICLYLPMIAFFVNMLSLAFLGRELAIEINNGTISTTTYLYSYILVLFLFLVKRLKNHV